MTIPITFSYLDLQPILQVENVEKSLKYYKDTLGFSVDWTWNNNDDSLPISHAGVSFGNIVDNNQEHSEVIHIHLQLTLSSGPVTPTELFFTVGKEIDELYKEYKNRNMNLISDLQDRPWGMREFHIKDDNGNIFRFAYNKDH